MEEVCVIFYVILAFGTANNPCSPGNYIELDHWQRSTGNSYYGQNTMLCDNFLPPGWYRPTSPVGNRMPTECVRGGFRCGTTGSIWLNGTYPAVGLTSNVTACAADYTGRCCYASYNIQVKNCGTYYVYNLTRTNGCYQAYCFGNESKCPVGETSDNGGFTPGCEFDPCQGSNYKVLNQEVKRSARYRTQTSDIAIEDSRLPTGWYRINSAAGNDIATDSVPILHCGTVYPLWMNGSLPSTSEKTVSRKVCKSGVNGICEEQYDIRIRNCGSYRTYHLQQLNVEKAAYCFGTEIKCPVGETSDSEGFTPGCEFDPCHESNYQVLTQEIKRSANYMILPSDPVIEDSRLATGWYRINSITGNDIVNYSVPMHHCGTVFPLWMNGTLPSISDKTVNRKACKRGIDGLCEEQYDIQIRNCGSYRTYYLQQLNVDKAAYCFGSLPVPTTAPPPHRSTPPVTEKPEGGHDKSKDQGKSWTIFIIVTLLAVLCTLLLFVQIIWCYRNRNIKNQTVSCMDSPPPYQLSNPAYDKAVYFKNDIKRLPCVDVKQMRPRLKEHEIRITAVHGIFQSAPPAYTE